METLDVNVHVQRRLVNWKIELVEQLYPILDYMLPTFINLVDGSDSNPIDYVFSWANQILAEFQLETKLHVSNIRSETYSLCIYLNQYHAWNIDNFPNYKKKFMNTFFGQDVTFQWEQYQYVLELLDTE